MENFYINDDGHCVFDWSDDLNPCYGTVPEACVGASLRVKGAQVSSNFWELRFCEPNGTDTACPTSYNEDIPRLAVKL